MRIGSSFTMSSLLSSHHSLTTVLSILLLLMCDTVSSFSHQSMPTATSTTASSPRGISSNGYTNTQRRSIPSSSSSQTMPTFWDLRMTSSDEEEEGFTGSTYSRSEGNGDDSVAMKEPEPEVKCPDCDQCDGSGRILGGIATVIPWFIKAYRPCPVFIERGGNYVRSGQPLDEIAFGRKGEIEDMDEYNS